jgi:hypothetical protein
MKHLPGPAFKRRARKAKPGETGLVVALGMLSEVSVMDRPALKRRANNEKPGGTGLV